MVPTTPRLIPATTGEQAARQDVWRPCAAHGQPAGCACVNCGDPLGEGHDGCELCSETGFPSGYCDDCAIEGLSKGGLCSSCDGDAMALLELGEGL